jgi:hypothetical protein
MMKSIRTGEGHDSASSLSLTTQEGALEYQEMAMQRAIEEASKRKRVHDTPTLFAWITPGVFEHKAVDKMWKRP